MKDQALLFLALLGVMGLLGFVFYDAALLGALFGIPLFFFGRKYLRKWKMKRRRARLKPQFLSAVTMLGDYLKTGYSVENALTASARELNALYGEKNDIVQEWSRMARELRMNQTAEEVVEAFAERSGVPEVQDFSEVFSTVKRSGGQISEVVRQTSDVLTEQFTVQEQIRTTTAAKRLEQKIMDVMPLGILLYIRVSSPDLLLPLYTSAFGRILMTVCLVAYAGAVLWAEKIVAIEI